MADINEELAAAKAKRISVKYGVNSVAIKVDITSKAEVERLVDIVLKKFGRIDILINGAGISRDYQDRRHGAYRLN